MEYSEGDVVIAFVPYMDRHGGKKRPVVIIQNKGSYHYVCCCTSKDKSDKYPGISIEKDSLDNMMYNFKESTFVNFSYHLDLPNDSILYKIGRCPRMDLSKIKDHFGIENDSE